MLYLIKRPFALLGLLVLGFAVLSLLVSYAAEPTYAKTMREEGWPTSFEELERAWYAPLSPGENAAEDYILAGQQLLEARWKVLSASEGAFPQQQPGSSSVEAPQLAQRAAQGAFSLEQHGPVLAILEMKRFPRDLSLLTDEQRRVTAQYVREGVPALDLARAAAEKGSVRFEIDFDDPYGVHREQVSYTLQRVDEYLSLLAVQCVLDQDKPGLMEAVRLHIALSEALRDEPIIISQLRRWGYVQHAVRSLEWALDEMDFSAEELAELRGLLAIPRQDPEMHQRVFVTEFLGMKRYVEEPWRFMSYEPSVLKHPAYAAEAFATYLPPRLAGYEMLNRTAMVRTYRTILASAAGPARSELADEQDESLEQLARLTPLAAGIMPSNWSPARWGVQRDLADAALAVEQFRLAEGRLPQSLEELVPAYLDAVPKDGYTGALLRFRATETGYMVYSLGYDGEDNSDLDPELQRKRDTVFEVRDAG